MRRLSLLVVFAAALTCAPTAAAKTTFVVWGRGWGHGVGMSQWGAFGMASQGSKYKQILGHYYTGTTVETRTMPSVSVLLASGKSSVVVGSASDFKVGTKVHPMGEARVTPTSTGRIKVEGLTRAFASPVTMAPNGSPLSLNGTVYRGSFIVSVVGGRLRVVNRVSMQGYLKGVVPRESPSSWPIEALKAQAVAARSYARTSSGKCNGYLCPDTRDQVYGGILPPSNADTAVDETKGEVVTTGSSVAQTFFYSSSGGRTATPKDGFGPAATNLSYLQSVKDPADLNSSNPNRFWQHVYTPVELGKALGTAMPVDVTATRNVSGRADQVSVKTGGGPTTLSGFTVRSRLGLRSTRFWVVVQTVNASSSRSACKKTVTLDVFVRGASKLVLERKPVTASSWSNVPLTTIDATHYRATQRPCVSTDYRVRTRYTARSVLGHLVFPDIGMNVNRAGTAMHGSVNPLLPGRTVTIQRHTASGWKEVASTTIRSDGTFRAAFKVVAGNYRARVVPPSGSGLVTGFSPVLHVVTS